MYFESVMLGIRMTSSSYIWASSYHHGCLYVDTTFPVKQKGQVAKSLGSIDYVTQGGPTWHQGGGDLANPW